MSLKTILLILVSVLFGTSCAEDPECTQEVPYDFFTVVFYDKNDYEAKNVKFDFILNSDSTLVYEKQDSSETLSAIRFQLNPNADTSEYYFFTGVKADTLQVIYSRELEWLSTECGPNFFYDGLDGVSETFDSINVVQTIIDASVDENIRLYN